jgi:hypothetical protein
MVKKKRKKKKNKPQRNFTRVLFFSLAFPYLALISANESFSLVPKNKAEGLNPFFHLLEWEEREGRSVSISNDED